MRRDNADLARAAVLTAAAATALLLTGRTAAARPVITVLRVIAGLPLVLALPGYALSTLLLPNGSWWPEHINPALWRAMWTVGLSLAVTVLGGLALNATPAGLTGTSWTISLTVVTLLALAATAALRTRGLRTLPRPASRASARPASANAAPGTRARSRARVGYGLAALAVTGTAIGLAQVSTGWQHTSSFAQLWLVPAPSSAVTEHATLGVRNAYPRTESFHLVLRRGTRMVVSWDASLAPGQTWQQAVTASGGQRMTARLTTPDSPSVAQTVQVTP